MQVSSCWNEQSSLADTLSILGDLSLRHALEGGPVGSQIAALVRQRDWKALCDFELEYHDDWNVYHLIQCRQALAFFTKLEDLDIGVNKEQAAWKKFELSEQRCKETNRIFNLHLAGGFHFLPRDTRILYAIRRKIAAVLGPCPKLGSLQFKFGPGSTTSTKKSAACPTNKMAGPLTCSYNLYRAPELSSYLREVPHWTNQHSAGFWVDPDGWLCEGVYLEITPGILEFVPKNAKTYRAIVKPPTLNSFVQQGWGRYMTRRLLAAGIDITDQTLNAKLARIGSITGRFATRDLVSASDTNARELVRFLVHSDWYHALSSGREDSVLYRGKEYIMEKFSSMGNGFTFPLETLIFWAITRVVCEGEISVYGDDIVCPSEYASEVDRVLSLCGFEVNTEKSYAVGPFRESCGKDYYKGIDIRPYYQKTRVSGLSLFVLHNFYYRRGCREYCSAILDLIPETLRIYGPDGYGDGHLLGDYHRKTKKEWIAKGYCGHTFDTFTQESRRLTPRYPGDYISPLYHIYTRCGTPVFPILYEEEREEQLCYAPEPIRLSKHGYPLWGLPGTDGYKRISIYTFA